MILGRNVIEDSLVLHPMFASRSKEDFEGYRNNVKQKDLLRMYDLPKTPYAIAVPS